MRPPRKKLSDGLKKPAGTDAYSLEENPLDILRKKWFRWLNTKVGILGGALLGATLGLWIGWESVSKLPGIDVVTTAWQEWRGLPRSKGDRFSVVIAQLENDPNGVHQRLIDDALRERFANDEIEILRTPISINIASDQRPQDAVASGHAHASTLLQKANINVMIWGAALSADTKAPVRLHWTVNAESKLNKSTNKYLPDQANYDLPALFWADLDAVLNLVVTSQTEPFLTQTGTYVADKLEPSIKRVRLLLSKESSTGSKQPALWLSLATSLTIYGEQRGDLGALREAVMACRKALDGFNRDRAPLDWARTQNALGNALWEVGKREGGTARLEDAVAAFREASKEFTREKVPLQWAMTQNNLGTALAELGGREGNAARLEEAADAYQAALEEFTRERAPSEWAATRNNLGLLLQKLGERESGTVLLERAVALHKEALKERPRDQVPLDWARMQSNLGNALFKLGEREDSAARVKETVTAFREALKELKRDQVPLEWAMTQSNLCTALMKLGSGVDC